MKKESLPRRSSRTQRQSFQGLAPYMKKVAKGSMKRHSLYTLCVKASVAKCYEFNLAVPSMARAKSTFFAMSALRGICEDLIILRFIGQLPPKDRQALLGALTDHQLAERIRIQDIFFGSFRPQQPVLRLKDVDSRISASEAAAQTIWKRHGWPNMKRGEMPPVRQIAEKQGLHHLAVLYDYLYRLTSASVHFSVQSLLRSGWGSPTDFVFSTKNFRGYFDQYCGLYGAFLFCLYFEFFGRVLRPGVKQRELVAEIRGGVLYTRRWPELVTFEEMNQREPTRGETFRMIVSALQAATRKRLMSSGANYSRPSTERRMVKQALELLARAAKESKTSTPSAETTQTPD